MSHTTRRTVLTGAAGLATAAAYATAANAGTVSNAEIVAQLGLLLEEICQRGLYHEAASALAPFLDRTGKIAISKYLVADAIEAIEHLYDPGDEWPTLQPQMRECSAFVATRLKQAISGEPSPFRWDPDL